VPRLVRFYGGSPWAWLAETPVVMVRACLEMMDSLEAEEALYGASVSGVGAALGSNGDWAEKQLGRWRRALGPEAVVKGPLPQGMGIKVVQRG